MSRSALWLSAFAAAGVMVGSAMTAWASPLVYEGFDYSTGANLSNQVNPYTGNTWLRPSSPAGSTQVMTGAFADYPGLSPGTGNALLTPRGSAANNSENRIDIPGASYTRPDGDSVFFSFTFQLTEWDAIADASAKNATHRKGGLIGGFHGGAASVTTSMASAGGFAGALYVRREIDYAQTGTDLTPGAQTNKYELGILKTATSPATAAELEAAFDLSQSFSVGDTIFVIGQYQFVNDATTTGDIARLWINPTPGALAAEATPSVSAPVGTINLGGSLGIESFHLRADTNSPGDIIVDEVRVGATFADVSVPEPTSLALLAIGSAMLMRRGRRQV